MDRTCPWTFFNKYCWEIHYFCTIKAYFKKEFWVLKHKLNYVGGITVYITTRLDNSSSSRHNVMCDHISDCLLSIIIYETWCTMYPSVIDLWVKSWVKLLLTIHGFRLVLMLSIYPPLLPISHIMYLYCNMWRSEKTVKFYGYPTNLSVLPVSIVGLFWPLDRGTERRQDNGNQYFCPCDRQ